MEQPISDMITTAMMRVGNPWLAARYPPIAASAALVRSVSVKYTPHSVPSFSLSIWRVNIAIYVGKVNAVNNPRINWTR